ncbi:MAG TPA: type II secretion system major pseudopilin GspG [Phycisphaeraceae bacterium]
MRKWPISQKFDRPRRRRIAAAGFTLVEIIVVVIVIGVLATLIVPNLFSRVGKAKHSVAQQKLAALEQAIQIFSYDYGRYPQSLDELVNRPADIDPEKWTEPTVKDKDLIDPWGNPWGYRYPGDQSVYDLFSFGADGQPGGDGENADVTNW